MPETEYPLPEPPYPAALERKAHGTEQPESRISDEYLVTFEQFKQTNDSRPAALESRGSVDPLVEEKLQRIERKLSGLYDDVLASRRPALDGMGANEHDQDRHAIVSYIRKGRTDELERLESKGLSVGSEADGGFLVPPEMESALSDRLRSDSPIRSIATNMLISTTTYRRALVKTGAGAGWTAETSTRNETSSPQLAEFDVSCHGTLRYACRYEAGP